MPPYASAHIAYLLPTKRYYLVGFIYVLGVIILGYYIIILTLVAGFELTILV